MAKDAGNGCLAGVAVSGRVPRGRPVIVAAVTSRLVLVLAVRGLVPAVRG
ncbi:hypothetical protein FHS43_004327 [Streptosporangium becharense]|uniref:Uncharacterized protein n=1 Tax=Streptosporangium becharense TaxID=1816182 RepID=A0A7W9MFA9_9ACTN|nr:hypothetical protein [Streptosporangium becharense]MBB2913032.1 hypothetical protein [Streptosporangium becharense]MBB5818143.1 hypothetical protein [Streptosporangium becharense]